MQGTDNQGRREYLSQAVKKSILFNSSNLVYIQLGELQKSIKELVTQNKYKFGIIVESKADFKYQLYRIGQFQSNSKAYGKELLLRQMDRLLEQKNYLDRQLSLISFHDEEEIIEKENMVSNQTEHFELLKSIWKKDSSHSYAGNEEHIQQLNLMVGQIKGNIKALVKFESNNNKEFEDTYLNTCRLLQEKSRDCSKCHELIAKNDYLQQKLDKIEEKLSKMSEENIVYLEDINGRDDKIKRLTKHQIKLETELKDKIIGLERDVLKKDQIIKLMKKEIQVLNQNKFVNESQGFELIIRGASFGLDKFQKKITITCQELIRLITQEMRNQLRVTHQINNRYSTVSKGNSTETSNVSLKDLIREQQEMPPKQINQEQNIQTIQNNDVLNENSGKFKNVQKPEPKQRQSEMQTGPKRYMRTSGKRGSHSIISEAEGFLSVKMRAASPSYGTNTD